MSRGETYLEKSGRVVSLLEISSFIDQNWQRISEEMEQKYQIATRSDKPSEAFVRETEEFVKSLLIRKIIPIEVYYFLVKTNEEFFPGEDDITMLLRLVLAYIVKKGYEKYVGLCYWGEKEMMWDEMMDWIREAE